MLPCSVQRLEITAKILCAEGEHVTVCVAVTAHAVLADLGQAMQAPIALATPSCPISHLCMYLESP